MPTGFVGKSPLNDWTGERVPVQRKGCNWIRKSPELWTKRAGGERPERGWELAMEVNMFLGTATVWPIKCFLSSPSTVQTKIEHGASDPAVPNPVF